MSDFKKVLVIGGSGFLGRHVISELLKRNYVVRSLNQSYENEFENLGIEQQKGSVLSEPDIAIALKGIDVVIHLAGLVSRDKKDTQKMKILHEQGIQLVLEQVSKQNRKIRVVYASTSGTIACSARSFPIATEASPQLCEKIYSWAYYNSKINAERKAFEVAALYSIELICLNPSLLLGPGDVRLSSTSDLLKLFQGKIPFSARGGINFVDVRDVAVAFVNAITKGKAGEKYLLGSENMSLTFFFNYAANLSGKNSPLFTAPPWLTKLSANFSAFLNYCFGIPLLLDTVSEEMSRCYWYFDNSKAKRELLFSPRPPSETILDTFIYFRKIKLI